MKPLITDGSFKALADELPSLVFVADSEGAAIYCNRKLCDFTGLSGAALVGGGWLLAIHEEDRAPVQAAWRQALAAEEPYEVEYRLRAADGHYHWFLHRCVPARTNGVVDHWVGVGLDVHDRKLSAANASAAFAQSQDALAGSEARYRTIFQTMFNFVGLLTTDGVLLEVNEAALAFSGVSADAVIGRRFWDLPLWDGNAAEKLRLRGAIAAAAAGEFVRYEAVVRAAEGRSAIIDLTLTPVVDDAGVVRQILPEGRDLTHVKAVEEALRQSQARVQRIINSGIIGVGFGSVDGTVTEVNDAFLRMIGQTRDDLAAGAISWRDLTAPEYAERDARAIAELARDGVCTPYEKEYVLPDRRLPVQIVMASVEPTTPGVDHLALIIDLTAQRDAQAALAASHAQLEQRVAERTAELQDANARLVTEMKRRAAVQSALLQSQKLEALGQLTSSVAHDFNNVLAAIVGGFALIDRRTDDPRLQKLAAEGTKAAERGADLIRKLLAFARQQTIVARRVELEVLFDELEPQLRHVAGSKVEVSIAEARGLPAVEIDPSQLQAAITNLVANARDAMRDGGKVRIRFEALAAQHPAKPSELGDAAAVAIHVTDTGAGMRGPVLQRVLEPFFTTKAPGKGTGLGLAMVHGLMMQSGGALRIESVVGTGTTVSLYIPVSLAPPAARTEVMEGELRAHIGGRVLLVEDDDLVRDVVTGQLNDLGYSVVLSHSAADALAVVKDGKPLAFVVTDHFLAGTDGVQLVAAVRGVRPNLPILFITGRADPQDLEHEFLLLKPFSPEALSRTVLDMLDAARVRGEQDAALDRMAARFRSPVLNRMLRHWRTARQGDGPPALKRVTVTQTERDHVAQVAVDQTRVPMTFDLVTVGAELGRRAETDFAWWRVEVTGTESEDSQEGAYRRCVRSRKPTYDFAQFDFGEEGGTFFERLLLPCSDDGINVTGLLAVVSFDETGPANEA